LSYKRSVSSRKGALAEIGKPILSWQANFVGYVAAREQADGTGRPLALAKIVSCLCLAGRREKRENSRQIGLCAELGIDEVLVHTLMGHALKGISRGYIARLVLQSGSAMRAAQATISRRIVAPLVGVKCSQMTEHRTMYYAVLSDGGSLTYGSTGFFATDKTEAAQKAKDWAKSFDLVQENAWLQVTANGVGVCTLRPGELRELRAQA
jgi:hypothetical protein